MTLRKIRPDTIARVVDGRVVEISTAMRGEMPSGWIRVPAHTRVGHLVDAHGNTTPQEHRSGGLAPGQPAYLAGPAPEATVVDLLRAGIGGFAADWRPAGEPDPNPQTLEQTDAEG